MRACHHRCCWPRHVAAGPACAGGAFCGHTRSLTLTAPRARLHAAGALETWYGEGTGQRAARCARWREACAASRRAAPRFDALTRCPGRAPADRRLARSDPV